jgi:hypothetical protein
MPGEALPLIACCHLRLVDELCPCSDSTSFAEKSMLNEQGRELAPRIGVSLLRRETGEGLAPILIPSVDESLSWFY